MTCFHTGSDFYFLTVGCDVSCSSCFGFERAVHRGSFGPSDPRQFDSGLSPISTLDYRSHDPEMIYTDNLGLSRPRPPYLLDLYKWFVALIAIGRFNTKYIGLDT